jgi:putative peptidoglycan lipid II flippase
MALTLYFAMGTSEQWFTFSLSTRLLYLSGLVVLGGMSYFASLYVLGFKPRDYMRRVKSE